MLLPWVKCSLCCASVGIILAIVGAVLGLFIIPPIIEQTIQENVKLKPGSEAYERWREVPQALHFKIYFFQILNPHEAMKGEKIKVEEVGPYIYDQYRKKTLIVSNSKTDEYTYEEVEHFEFNVEASAPRTEDDLVTILNVPLNALAQISEQKVSAARRILLNQYIGGIFPDYGKSMFHTVKVKDVLFSGYSMCPNYSKLGIIGKQVCNGIEKLSPKTVVRNPDKTYRFSFFNHKNASSEGYFTIKTGLTNYREVGQITKFNYSPTLSAWKGENSTCNQLRGTDATIFPPKVSKADLIAIYSKDVCRSFDIEYLKKTTYKGINTYRFNLAPENLAAASEALGTDCYCVAQTMDMEGKATCMRDGAMDLYPCHQAPVVLTLPHLYQADQYYVDNSVENLKPDPELHETFVDLEPNLGYPLQGVKRIQLNMFVRKVKDISVTDTIKPALVPVLWLDEGAALNDDLIEMINEQYFDIVKLLDYVIYGLVGLGILIFVLSMFNFCHHHNKTYDRTTVS